LLSSCSSTFRFTDKNQSISYSSTDEIPVGKVFRGKASYYSDKFHGKITASGEIFDQNKLTAAHRELPFGTKLKVKNMKNGKYVVVIINDRGPFVDGRILDLSYQAALQLDMIDDGVTDVECTVLK
jgi:rare lipoprotein A